MGPTYKRIALILALVVMVATIWSGTLLWLHNDASVYRENGPIESLQAVILTIGMLLYLGGTMLSHGPERLIHAFLALLCYTFTLRELDVERLDIPMVLKMFGSGTGRDMTIAAAFILLAAMASLKLRACFMAFVSLLKSGSGKMLLLAALSLLLGDQFEKWHAITHHVYFEESFELLGYSLIVLAALANLAGADGHRRPGA